MFVLYAANVKSSTNLAGIRYTLYSRMSRKKTKVKITKHMAVEYFITKLMVKTSAVLEKGKGEYDTSFLSIGI